MSRQSYPNEPIAIVGTAFRHSYILSEDPHAFDAHFFGVKPFEARAIDPQQRILLEAAYEALEASGMAMESIQGTGMGVFVGLMNEDYAASTSRDIQSLPVYFASGTARSTISNRLSYFFDIHGPSMTIDTACSSSLVALHQAVVSLRSGESAGALVAGANLLLGPEPYIASSNLNMLSPTGRSRMWDSKADGYARGDGFAVLVLKTLSQALADNDLIECIVRETGVNQDGRTKGITVPSPTAQSDLIRATYARAGLDLSKPSDRPQYFEAHGTASQSSLCQLAGMYASYLRAHPDVNLRDLSWSLHTRRSILSSKIWISAANVDKLIDKLDGAADEQGLAQFIQEALEITQDEGKFSRLLRVDQAYHSHHMLRFAVQYVEAIRRCNVQVNEIPSLDSPRWVSSVSGEPITVQEMAKLKDAYWGDNMVKPVLFSDAVRCAVGMYGPFDAVVEVGPHPALKTPTSETVQEIAGVSPPYLGTLRRGHDDLEAWSDVLGSLWAAFGRRSCDFAKFDALAQGGEYKGSCPKPLRGLPTYPWNHHRSHVHESRYSKAFKGSAGQEPHFLLGTLCPDQTKDTFRFKNRLHLKRIPWLAHHQIEGEVVFPATGYISAVVEALSIVLAAETVCQIEISDFVITKALLLRQMAEGVETCLTIQITRKSSAHLDAMFWFHSESARDSAVLDKNASGDWRVFTLDHSHDFLPAPCKGGDSELLPLDAKSLYSCLEDLGYGYSGLFQGLHETKRRMNEASGLIAVPEYTDENQLIAHPATLDCALQAVLLAHSYPGDGEMRQIFLPTRIDRISIDVSSLRQESSEEGGKNVPFHAFIQPSEALPSADIVGDVEIHSANGDRITVQLQGLHVTPLEKPSAANDVAVFFDMAWTPEVPHGRTVDWAEDEYSVERSLCPDTERIACFHLRHLQAAIPKHSRGSMARHHVCFLDWVDHCLDKIASGSHPHVHAEWMTDSEETIERLVQRQGEINILEAMLRDDMLAEFYASSLGMRVFLPEMGRIAGQIGARVSRLDILEIGAGVGAATSWILDSVVDNGLGTYTYTDISSGFFDKAQEKFAKYQEYMTFKVLDIEKNPIDQGFKHGSFDVVVASLVLHATRDLGQTMRNARKLLRPGGYLIMFEITDNEPIRLGLLFGGLPGWWAGYDDGRRMSPCVSIEAWASLMTQTGFSAIDAITPHNLELPMPMSVLVCQALDDRVELIRQPLMARVDLLPDLGAITLIGDAGICTSVRDKIGQYYKQARHIDALESLSDTNGALPLGGTVVSFVDLAESSFLQAPTEAALKAMRSIYKHSKVIVWLASGAEGERPGNNMFKGFQRTIALEMPYVHAQVVDFPEPSSVDAEMVGNILLRFETLVSWKEHGGNGDLRIPLEPDISIREGRVMVPRLRPNVDRNLRYNSTRRHLTHQVSSEKGFISLKPLGSSLRLAIDGNSRDHGRFWNGDEISLTHSLLLPIQITETCRAFLSVGFTTSGKPVFVLSGSLASRIQAPSTWVLPAPELPESAPAALVILQAHILGHAIVSTAVKVARSLVLLNPDKVLGSIVAKLSSDAGVEILLISTTSEASPPPWTYLHRRATKRAAMSILPRIPFVFIDMGGNVDDPDVSLLAYLPTRCHQIPPSRFIGNTARFARTAEEIGQVSYQLQAAWMRYSEESRSIDMRGVPTLGLEELDLKTSIFRQGRQGVLSWAVGERISVPVCPAGSLVSFSDHRTYWLVGLTGGLGLSLCEWMVDRGAKYIALSSRSPEISPSWIRSMATRSCTVGVFPWQVPTLKSVQLVFLLTWPQ
ncbi:unnamed protein product [Clonostachys solani]|uniref:Polyketide synthase n=1 Tax=Clonostachys solani TaxID=160281 RepID=A0A9N9ZFV8_9HYPO|nr:unnamed protein product [Clonostachys solani]